MTELKRFIFTVELAGVGEHPDEAWEDAYTAFALDPGEPANWHEEINISEE